MIVRNNSRCICCHTGDQFPFCPDCIAIATENNLYEQDLFESWKEMKVKGQPLQYGTIVEEEGKKHLIYGNSYDMLNAVNHATVIPWELWERANVINRILISTEICPKCQGQKEVSNEWVNKITQEIGKSYRCPKCNR